MSTTLETLQAEVLRLDGSWMPRWGRTGVRIQ